jgi:DNA invertase Pin-like site-specific DNA recombinase
MLRKSVALCVEENYNAGMNLIGYIRVSTQGQAQNGHSLEAQQARLREAGCSVIRKDIASGGKADRAELTKLLDHLHQGDVVVVTRLDRLARSLHDLLRIAQQIERAGAGLKSLGESIDTTTATGTLIFHVLGALAEFERRLLAERTKVGLEAAKRAGRKLGPHFKLSDKDQRQIAHLVRDGKMSAADCARVYRVHRSAITRLLARCPA